MNRDNGKALIVVDMLYDFIDGSLACQNAEEAVDAAVRFIDKMTDGQAGDSSEILDTFPILFVCDSHPSDHTSFKEYGGTWPKHCIAGTRGAEIHSSLAPYASEELTFLKGCSRDEEQYSGYEGRNSAGQSLGEVLELLDISDIYICGIATEYCVRNTAEDLEKAGFDVTLVKNALACVDKAGHDKAIREMCGEGIHILQD